MTSKTVHLPVLPTNLRKDAWWVGPALTVLVLSGLHRLRHVPRVRGNELRVAGVPVALLLAVLRRDLGQGHGPRASSRPPCSSCRGPRASVSPATTTARPTTARSPGTRPPAPSPSARRHGYNGETKLLLFQNLHRYAMYVALIFLVVLWKDVVVAVIGWKDGVHVGVGTLVMLANVILLTGYTFGCHSFRHLVGGGVNSYSTGEPRRLPPRALEARHGAQRAPPAPRVGEPLLGRADRRVHPHGRQRRHHRREALLDGRRSTRRTSTTSWSSAPAGPACARPSRRAPRG